MVSAVSCKLLAVPAAYTAGIFMEGTQMANIKKMIRKDGISYKITVSMGRTQDGRQQRHYKTFKPPQGTSESKADKLAAKEALQFEEELRLGYQPDNKITFAEYAEYFIKVRRKAGLKRSTYERYRGLLVRINAGIGHLKLIDIRPQHLNLFYDNLIEEGIRRTPAKASAKPAFGKQLAELGISMEELGRRAHISASTIHKARDGGIILWSKAEAIASAMDRPVEMLFIKSTDDSPLSVKTVLEHHRLIRTILGQAEKELLVQYNAASKATPPKALPPEVNSFQPQEITAILEALEEEPIKWRTIVHLMIVTGCRRGEIMGLKWENVDLESRMICVRETLLAVETGVYQDTPKTRESHRYINIPPETADLLREYRRSQSEIRTILGDRWEETGYVFTRENGLPMHPDSVNGWLSHFSERHGLPHINPHAFRHSMASILINSGTDILSISKRLGHANTSTTLNFYGHILQKADAQSAECIANVLLRKNPFPPQEPHDNV